MKLQREIYMQSVNGYTYISRKFEELSCTRALVLGSSMSIKELEVIIMDR